MVLWFGYPPTDYPTHLTPAENSYILIMPWKHKYSHEHATVNHALSLRRDYMQIIFILCSQFFSTILVHDFIIFYLI